MTISPRVSHGAGNALKSRLLREAKTDVLHGMAVGMSEGNVHLFRGPDEPVTRGVCQAPWHHGTRLERVYLLGTVRDNGARYECCDPCITRHTLISLAPSKYRKPDVGPQ